MSFRFLLRPRWLALTAVVLLAVAVMGRLSLWQWDRLDGRRTANASIEARADEPVVPFGELVPPGATAEEVADAAFRPVTVTGAYQPDRQVLVANRTYDGMAGWWVVTPLRTDDGVEVAVNRGWVPREVEPEGPWDDFAPPTGVVTVTGLLQESQSREGGPVDDPATLPRLNLDLLADRVGEPVAPLWVQLEAQEPAQATALPFTLPPPETDEGPHLSYAVQWILFALLTVTTYVVLVVRAARRGDDAGRPQGATSAPPPAATGAVDDGRVAAAPVDRGAGG